MNITKLERQLLIGSTKTNFGDARDCGTYVFAAFDAAEMNPTTGAGVLSSLVKKELVYVGEGEKVNGVGDPVPTFDLTQLGKETVNKLLAQEVDKVAIASVANVMLATPKTTVQRADEFDDVRNYPDDENDVESPEF